ncbi:uncharacterized protein [Hoplias malabaricus]|uniref:uncharacterized protein isoform X1 n=1 Tax=Hoplias malabaricus TaxID=27720 RepID=UPI003463082E
MQFEKLLVKQLQRQQNRAEFCDTVLQSQGVSVPVHSCVLSAFSPRLCGALSSMPSPVSGQRRLIELNHVDSFTLLSLVSLLYSGTLDTNRKDVLTAAELLGIQVPQQQGGQSTGETERRRSPDTARHHGGRLEKRGSEEEIRDCSTQTDSERETDERETQTDHPCSDSQQNIHSTGHRTCLSISQGHETCRTDSPMLHRAEMPPEKTPHTYDVLSMDPETKGCHLVSETVSQLLVCPPEFLNHHPPTPFIPNTPASSTTCVQHGPLLSGQGGMEEVVEGYEQFEGNIPGFISYFLNGTCSQSTRKRGRGRPRKRVGVRGEEAVRKARVRARSEGMFRRGRGRKGKGQSHGERWGWAPRLVWRGQGGGKVGRKLDVRSTGIQQMRRGRGRGRGSFLQGEWRDRGRQRQRGAHADSKGQDGAPCLRSPRSGPHLYPSLPPCSPSFFQNSTNSRIPEYPSLLHTTSLPPDPQMPSQPMDLLLDDIIAGLNFLPPVHSPDEPPEMVNTLPANDPPILKTTYFSMNSMERPTDRSHQQPEGELCDILDHFLSSFEQHISGCDFSTEEGTSVQQSQHSSGNGDGDQVRDPSSDLANNVYTHLQGLNQHSAHCHVPESNISHHCTHPSKTNSYTQPQPVRSSPTGARNQSRLPRALKRLKTPCSRGSKGNLEAVGKGLESQRITRSQSMKRKLETALASIQMTPPGKKRRGKCAATSPRKKVRSHMRRQQKDMQCTVNTCLREGVGNNVPTDRRKTTQTWSRNGTENNKNAMVFFRGHRGKVNNHAEESEEALRSWPKHSPLKSTVCGAYMEMASSAFEKMRLLLETQREREEEDWSRESSVRMSEEIERVQNAEVQESVTGAENTPSCLRMSRKERAGEAGKKERRVCADTETQGGVRKGGVVRCRQGSTGPGLEQVMADGCSTTPRRILLQSSESTRGGGETSDCNNNEHVLHTSEPQSIFDICSSNPASDVLHSPHSSRDLRFSDLTLDSGETTPGKTAQKLKLSDSPLHHEPLTPHTPEGDTPVLAGNSEEEVDVVEVSSSAYEPVAITTVIWEAELSTEEEVEEEVDVDVLGTDLDS